MNLRKLIDEDKVKPIHQKVALRFEDPDEYMFSKHIIVPEKHQSLNDRAIVAAVGTGIPDIKVGDKIILAKTGFQKVEDHDEAYYFVKYGDILAIET